MICPRCGREQPSLFSPCPECGRNAGSASSIPTDPLNTGTEAKRCPKCSAIYNGEQQTVWTRAKIIAAIQWWVSQYGKQPAQPDFNPTQAAYMGDYRRAVRAERHIAAREIPWFTTVVLEFGSWNAGIEAAGYQPLVPHGGGGNVLRRRKVAA